MAPIQSQISSPRLPKVKVTMLRAKNLSTLVSSLLCNLFLNHAVEESLHIGKVLPDAKTVASCEIKEKDFLVLMVSKVYSP